MKKILIVITIAAVAGILAGLAITYFGFLGVEENFINWAPEGAKWAL